MSSIKILASFIAIAIAMFLTIGESALAQEVELDEAKVFIEWNSTDGDQGIQFFWDSESFTNMTVSTDDGDLFVDTSGNVLAQGLTETAIESVEPEEEEQSLEEFFDLFPAGTYEFEGTSTEGDTITGEAEFTHDLLAPVVLTKINLPVIEWIEPEEDINGEPLDVVGYELVVELVVEVEEDGDTEERVFKESTNFPAGVNKHIVSNTFMDIVKNPPGETIGLKVEILAEEPSGNLTITEQAVIEED